MNASRSGPALAFALSVLLLLPVVRRHLHLTRGTAVGGFDPSVAHLLVALAAFACIALYAVLAHREPRATDDAPDEPREDGRVRPRLEAVLVFALFVVLYFPPFLQRYGPYGEDSYFLSVLQRVVAGQRPYAEFEFLYGPLLLFPIAGWISAFGYSLRAYYAFLALTEAATFAALAYGLGAVLPDRRQRLMALLVAMVLLINDNLGLSWIALRRLLPVVLLAVYVLQGRTRRGAWAATAAMLGVQIMLSLEYAASCVIALGAVGVAESFARRDWRPVLRAGLAAGGAFAVAAVLAWGMMGRDAVEWLAATRRIIALRGGGEAAFAFQLSVNAAAVFALLFVGCAWLGAGLPRLRGAAPTAGDLLVVASVTYAVVAMKSGLARSDMYHLVPPLLGIIGALLMRLDLAVFRLSPALRRAGVAALALTCLTYLPGLSGAGRLWARGLALGARDFVTRRPVSGVTPAASRTVLIGRERTIVNPQWIRMAEYFADPSRATDPVLFYERTWGLDKVVGVAKPRGVYPTDDYLVADEEGVALREFLERHPTALVVVDTTAWKHLLDSTFTPAYASMFWFGRVRSLPVRFLERWSSSHFGTAVIDERVRKRDRWARTVGGYVRAHFAPAETFGEWIVLARIP